MSDNASILTRAARDWQACEHCGQVHDMAVAPTDRPLRCVRCESDLRPSQPAHSACLALALSALVMFVAAILLPFAVAAKFGEVHAGYVGSGVTRLWSQGSLPLALLVALCGIVAPLGLTSLLSLVLLPRPDWQRSATRRVLLRLAVWCERWSMAEVQLLGVLVAFTKLSTLVDTTPGPGLWCYGIASALALLAWRRFDPATAARTSSPLLTSATTEP